MNTNQLPLDAPTIPVTQPDGLIKTSDLVNDVIVNFPLWPGARPNDMYQLTLDGFAVGNKEIIPTSEADNLGELRLMLPVELLNEDGERMVGYQVTSFPGGGTAESEKRKIRIDRRGPGGPLLAAIIFPNFSLDILKGRIATYEGMEPGDLIQTVCNGTLGPAYRVHPENLTTNPIEISFTREFLEGLFSDKVNITYHVTDRAGNRSILAQSIELTLQR